MLTMKPISVPEGRTEGRLEHLSIWEEPEAQTLTVAVRICGLASSSADTGPCLELVRCFHER